MDGKQMLKRLGALVLAVAVVMALSAGAAVAGKPVSDHDGDADSSSATQLEDGHEAEPDGDPSDNRHPSGKDRSAEHGKSGNQGKSESNPDDSKGPMRWEGQAPEDDKPNGLGGTDREDQDGNNGCGNDDDFDDDNNGWCGRKPSPPSGGEQGGQAGGIIEVGGEVVTNGAVVSAAGVEVLGESLVAARPEIPTQVLGVKLVAGQALPRTGMSWVPMFFLAVTLLGVGAMIVRKSQGQTT